MTKRLFQNWIVAAVDVRRLLALRHLPRYVADFMRFRRAGGSVSWRDSFPQLGDLSATTPFDPHYFHQGAWIARRLAQANPVQHVDVGSSVLTMSVLSGHVPTVLVDYRPLKAHHVGLASVAGDICRLPFADASIASLSCLHVIEHIGLGRYGDPIDPSGARRAANELQRVVRNNGKLYLTTPVGRERVCFNAHRVFAPATIVSFFDEMALIGFSYVDDDGRFHADTTVDQAQDLEYGCGFFEFQRVAGAA